MSNIILLLFPFASMQSWIQSNPKQTEVVLYRFASALLKSSLTSVFLQSAPQQKPVTGSKILIHVSKQNINAIRITSPCVIVHKQDFTRNISLASSTSSRLFPTLPPHIFSSSQLVYTFCFLVVLLQTQCDLVVEVVIIEKNWFNWFF